MKDVNVNIAELFKKLCTAYWDLQDALIKDVSNHDLNLENKEDEMIDRIMRLLESVGCTLNLLKTHLNTLAIIQKSKIEVHVASKDDLKRLTKIDACKNN